MTGETTTETSARYVPVPRETWEAYFDAFTKLLEGRGVEVEIEVAGRALGDQIQAHGLPLNGVTYDRKADTFYIYVESVDRDLDHAIAHPREIFVEAGALGLQQVVVIDGDGQQHFVRLRQPIALPARA